MRWSTALAAGLLLVVLAGDALSSFASRGSPATAPFMAPQAADTRSASPAGQVGETGVAPALTPVPRKAGQPETSQSGGAATGVVPPAGVGALSPADQQRDGEASPRPDRAAQPTGVGRQSSPASGLPALRVAEIGLAGLVAVLVIAGLLLRRIRGYSGGRSGVIG